MNAFLIGSLLHRLRPQSATQLEQSGKARMREKVIIMRPNTSKSHGWPSVSVLVKLIKFSFPCEMLLTAEGKKYV